MKKHILISLGFFVLLNSGCSIQFNQPKNAWQVKAVSAFQNYQKYYLEGRVILADSERRKAISQAKQSAKLETLARVYIADCAIQAAVLNPSDCALYLEVRPLIKEAELEAYYNLLTGQLKASEIEKLPPQYQGFGEIWISGRASKLSESVLAISPLESQLVAASIAKEQLSLSAIRSLIQKTADYGYKLASIRWMTYLSDRTPDENESVQLLKKIEILTKEPS